MISVRRTLQKFIIYYWESLREKYYKSTQIKTNHLFERFVKNCMISVRRTLQKFIIYYWELLREKYYKSTQIKTNHLFERFVKICMISVRRTLLKFQLQLSKLTIIDEQIDGN